MRQHRVYILLRKIGGFLLERLPSQISSKLSTILVSKIIQTLSERAGNAQGGYYLPEVSDTGCVGTHAWFRKCRECLAFAAKVKTSSSSVAFDPPFMHAVLSP